MPTLSKLLLACVAASAAAFAPAGSDRALDNQQVTAQAVHAEAQANFDKKNKEKNFDILQALMSGDHKSAIQSLKDLVLYKQSVLGKTVCNDKVHKMFSTNCRDADENSPAWFIQFCEEMKEWRREHPDDPCLPCEPGSHAPPGAHIDGHAANCPKKHGSPDYAEFESGSGSGGGDAPSPPPPSPPSPPHPPEVCVSCEKTPTLVGWEWSAGACVYPEGGAYRRCAFASDLGGPANEDECLMLAASVTGAMAAEMERVNTSHICHIFLPWDTLCYEVGLGRKTVGYHSSGCKNCLEYRYSPKGFYGKHCKGITMPPSPPPSPSNPDRPAWEAAGTDWMCSWPPCPSSRAMLAEA